MRRRLTRRTPGVDSHDLVALRTVSARTRVVRAVLVVLALSFLAAAAASAQELDTRERGLLPSGSTSVVVIDLSLSITDEAYNDVRAVLRRIVAEDAPIGLVVFSDIPYELLPPGTPASEMKPILRLLVPPRLGSPVNPWVQTFRAGTRISAALDLARGALERDGVENGAIFLVSDLQTAPDDVARLARTLTEIKAAGHDVRVFPLSPLSDARALFAGLLEEDAFAAPLEPDSESDTQSEARSSVPVGFLVLGALVFVVLALHERFGGRLSIPRLQGSP